MDVKTFDIGGVNIVDAGGRADWNYVKDTPTISITDNNHSHATRYYTKAEVDTRIASLTSALNDLQTKVNNLK